MFLADLFSCDRKSLWPAVIVIVSLGLMILPSSSGAQPSLAGEKNVGLAIDADGDGEFSPGDTLAYSLRVQNSGDAPATEIVLTDPIPFATTLVPGSIFIAQGTLLDEDPIVVSIGELAGGLDSTSVGFRVLIDADPPAGTTGIANQATVSSFELPDIVNDDPSTPEPLDPTVAAFPVSPILVDVPAAGPWGLMALAILIAFLAVSRLKR